MKSDDDEFRVGKMGVLYEAFLEECIENSVEFLNGARYVSVKTLSGSEVLADLAKRYKHSNFELVANARCSDTIVNLEKQGEEIQIKTNRIH